MYHVAPAIARVLDDQTISAQDKLLLIIRKLPFRQPRKLTQDVLGTFMGLTTRRVKLPYGNVANSDPFRVALHFSLRGEIRAEVVVMFLSTLTSATWPTLKVKTRAEHRLGEVLKETVKHQGGRPAKNGNTVLPLSNGDIPKPITKMQSSRAQQLAEIPWKEIEKRIDAQTSKNEKDPSPASEGSPRASRDSLAPVASETAQSIPCAQP
jgi:hypothetical protein